MRQFAAVLADAWATTEDIRGDADFQAKWMKIRAEALQAAGMPAYFQ